MCLQGIMLGKKKTIPKVKYYMIWFPFHSWNYKIQLTLEEYGCKLCVIYIFSIVKATVVFQSLSCVQLFATPRTAARQASLSFTISQTCSNSCPLSQWCHPTISSSVVPFSSRLQSFPASGSFPMSQFFASGGQSIGASASVSGLPMNIHSGLISFRTDWFDLLSVQWTFKESSPAPQFESISSSVFSLLYGPALIAIHDS